MKQVFLINDTSEHPNWGSRATTAALHQLISSAGGEVFASLPLKQLSKPNWNTSPKRQRFRDFIEARAQGNKLSKKLASVALNRSVAKLPDVIPNNYSQFASYAKKVERNEVLVNIAKNIKDSNMVLINGEGSMKGKNRESRAMLFLAYVAKKIYHKPVALINHTADFCYPDLKEMAQNVYPLLDEVVFREQYSAQKCSEFIKATVAADVAFIYKPAPYQNWIKLASRSGYYHHFPECSGNFDPSQPYICIGGSSAYSKNNYPDFRELCKRLKEEFGQVVLTTSAKIDETIFCPIAKELNLPLIPLITSSQQAVDILGHAKAYIGGRWHGAIFAFSGGTPVIPLASENFKLEALMQQMQIVGQIFDAFEFEEKEIIELCKTYIADTNLRNKISKQADELSKTVNKHLALVSNNKTQVELNIVESNPIKQENIVPENVIYN